MNRIPESNKARNKRVKGLMESSDEVYICYFETGTSAGDQSFLSYVTTGIEEIKELIKDVRSMCSLTLLADLDSPLPLGETTLFKCTVNSEEGGLNEYGLCYVRRLK